MSSVNTTRVVWMGYTLEIEDLRLDDGTRDITISDPRMYLSFGALVHYEPTAEPVNKIQCMFPNTWAERTRVEDLPCLLAIVGLVYCYAKRLADEHGVWLADYVPMPFQLPTALPLMDVVAP